MSGNDLIKHVTEQLVTYMNLTKDERKKRKKKSHPKMYTNQWLGIIPFAFKTMRKKKLE